MNQKKTRREGWYWPWAIGATLSLWAAGDIAVLVVAMGHPSFAVEDDYYQKALAWDSAQAERHRSDQLGWDVAISCRRVPTAPTPGVEVELTLTDAAGEPIVDAEVTVRAFHAAVPKSVLEARFASAGPGVYRGSLPMVRQGLWQFEVAASHGDSHFRAICLENYWDAP